jgi:SAM-dependent methyltransferase
MPKTGPIRQHNLPAAENITHLHILASLNSLIQASPDLPQHIHLCDIGCGDGRLLSYLATCLPLCNPNRTFEFSGLDVDDSGVQADGFFGSTITRLDERHPAIDWAARLHLITSRDPWPFKDTSCDFVISNQVLEHVVDHDAFLKQTYRVLSTGGLSLHLFPLKHYFWEGHIHMPLVHRFRQNSVVERYIAIMSWLGIGSYAAHRKQYGMTIAQYAEEHADYMSFMTNYLTDKQILDKARHHRFRADFSYTKNFYSSRLRMIFRRPELQSYNKPRPILDTMFFSVLKRVSSITLVLTKKQIYAR